MPKYKEVKTWECLKARPHINVQTGKYSLKMGDVSLPKTPAGRLGGVPPTCLLRKEMIETKHLIAYLHENLPYKTDMERHYKYQIIEKLESHDKLIKEKVKNKHPPLTSSK